VTVKRHGSRKAYKIVRKTSGKGRVTIVLKGLKAGRYDITITARPALGGTAPRPLKGRVRVA
jgi:hypothetical protein